jgi:hypothetical protein
MAEHRWVSVARESLKMNAARKLILVVMTPPINGPTAAPMPPRPPMTPKARAREVRS